MMGVKVRNGLRSLGAVAIVTIVTLALLEIALRVADFRELRDGVSERSLSYRYDAELGWMPVPGLSADVTNARTVHVKHNSLGLRDDEFVLDGKPTIMFLGDSFVWGLDAEADERFTELLKPRIANDKILAAGVSGFGTDQEYLLLQKLWPKVKPAVVVLIVCTGNDRDDNSTNIVYEGYQKPYFVTTADGSLALRGQPVPKSRLQAIKEDWWVRNSWLVRLANAVYLKFRHPKITVPDPTDRLVDMIRDYVESHGAKFLVGMQTTDADLVHHLEAVHVPFVTFDGAGAYPGLGIGGHWTPEGHKLVAERLLGLLQANHVIEQAPAATGSAGARP
ncbi:SGNH/GDSL hydrolase family protein [Bradyrhizobium sp. GCM10023182]|uniref:SGNH/GDSL hydrolase family protein n=1 Tax=Bradyrhizobium zhengyangense TaxID=2911009 RepID=A0ABS9LPX9_9BRAD|nr:MULTISPECIES: SGNH/GDSL hydrolase family protein [Bradyrhizobium]MCG2638709.1 SGNH/GDSL hydrolase family protein [Bradyrhizobium zhengyangense]MCG2669090.1 SGNH/GDSL hydrolase family protein [Bradyrhizobium zhengyangense]